MNEQQNENSASSGRSDSKALLACPFCGSEAVLIAISTIYWDNYAVMCDGTKNGNCAGLGGSSRYDTKEEAIAAWNTRAG